MVTIDVDGLRNVGAVHRATLGKEMDEEGQDTEEVTDENSPAAEPLTLNDRRDDGLEDEAEMWHDEKIPKTRYSKRPVHSLKRTERKPRHSDDT